MVEPVLMESMATRVPVVRGFVDSSANVFFLIQNMGYILSLMFS